MRKPDATTTKTARDQRSSVADPCGHESGVPEKVRAHGAGRLSHASRFESGSDFPRGLALVQRSDCARDPPRARSVCFSFGVDIFGPPVLVLEPTAAASLRTQ